jgi:hypothetical protein
VSDLFAEYKKALTNFYLLNIMFNVGDPAGDHTLLDGLKISVFLDEFHGPTVKKHLSRDYVGLIGFDER